MTTYKKIIQCAGAIMKVGSTDLSARQSIQVAKLIKKLQSESELYYAERDKICKKYGKLTEDGKSYVIAEENREAAAEKLRELDDIEVDIGEKIGIKLDDRIRIDAATLLLCEDFIEFIFEEDENNGK